MGALAELNLRTSYHKGRDNIANDFFLPCMQRATRYDRAVAFFRSTIFVIAWPALRDFIKRGGTMRVLCSQVLSKDDIAALDEGYAARINETLATRLAEEIRDALNDQQLREPTRILATLVAKGILDLQIAILHDDDLRGARGRIFHDKLGIFKDDEKNTVIFKGSMNETWNGLSADGNLESVDVAASWMGARDIERVTNEERYFDDLWKNRYPTLRVQPFPDVARNELVQAAHNEWEEPLDKLIKKAADQPTDTRGRTLRPHQATGLASWRANDRRGILEFATGSGKTFTAITAIREAITEHSNVVMVVVPDRVLFKQWHEELQETLADLNVSILRAGAGFNNWRESLRIWTAQGDRPRLVLATVQTASSPDFRSQIAQGPHLMLVADEVHRLGSPVHSALMDERLFGARLGLSATPERAGDPGGTNAILTYFRGILEPRYTLADAVRDGVLTRYFYRPHVVELTQDENQDYEAQSAQIATLQARINTGNQTTGLYEKLKRLLIRRARIIKQARDKVNLAVNVLTTEYSHGQRWIVYCDDLNQLNSISQSLLQAGIQNLPFHSQMDGDRNETLRWLQSVGGVVVAIKCLDEGVDIPSVTHALILASSKNPREFIQRRGRVLRQAPNKPLAYVHDAIVVPPRTTEERRPLDPITAGELARAVEFAQHADNPAAAADLQQIAIDAGIEWRTMINNGVEDEED